MNAAFHQIIGAKDTERLELFLASARRSRLLFKGGAPGQGSPTSRPMTFATNPPRASALSMSARIRLRTSSRRWAFAVALMV